MIINIRWPHKHNWRVRIQSINELGADYFCTKCLKTDYMHWQTLSQIYNAELYLIIKESSVMANRLIENI